MNIQYELNGELFVWNQEKAELNWRKHGVQFEEAAAVFFDPFFVLTDASRNDEARNAAIGFDSQARLLFVVHVEIEDTCIRLISARRADPHEEKIYVD
ncbi:BrnT family toxin [Comamonas sp. J-3]|uniref:BrnT family toxin n=1 Tax=Comamonas trifloxystrobinivorans TaxID=3350256 RepID=UPI00372748FC